MRTPTRFGFISTLLAWFTLSPVAQAGGPYVIHTVSPCRAVDTRTADPQLSTFSGDRLAPGETVPFFVTGALITGQGKYTDDLTLHADLFLVHAPSVYDFRERDDVLPVAPGGRERVGARGLDDRDPRQAVDQPQLVHLV